MADVDIEINTDLHKIESEGINDDDLIQYESDGGEAQDDAGTFDLEEPVMVGNQVETGDQDFQANDHTASLSADVDGDEPIITEHDIAQPEDMSLLDAAAEAAENDAEVTLEESIQDHDIENDAADAGDIDYDISLDAGDAAATGEEVAATEDTAGEANVAVTKTTNLDDDNDEIGWEHDEESAPSALFAPEEEQPTAVAVDEDNQEQSATQEMESADDGFPSITVHYKGEEFPFLAYSNGFFSDASILDETMDELLTSLRAELHNELTDQDEVVFQVDELGLEFSQVRSRKLDVSKYLLLTFLLVFSSRVHVISDTATNS